MLNHENFSEFRQGKISQFFREWGLSLILVLSALFWMILIGGHWASAQELDSNGDRSTVDRSDDEYSFNWLDPEKKIYVLQNRKYLKAGHAQLSLLGGIGFSNPYRSTLNGDARLAYYFSEDLGVEFFYTKTANSNNNTYNALVQSSGTGSGFPTIREIASQSGGMIHFVPWYAKINVFNSILYFDWYFGLGGGMIQSNVDTRATSSSAPNYVSQSTPGLFLSTGHLYHLSERFIARIDVTAAFYQTNISGTSGDTAWYSNYNFGVGFGWRL